MKTAFLYETPYICQSTRRHLRISIKSHIV